MFQFLLQDISVLSLLIKKNKTEVPGRSQAVFLHLDMPQGFKRIYDTASKSEVVCLQFGSSLGITGIQCIQTNVVFPLLKHALET